MRVHVINKYPNGFLTATKFQACISSGYLKHDDFVYAATLKGLKRKLKRRGYELDESKFTERSSLYNPSTTVVYEDPFPRVWPPA